MLESLKIIVDETLEIYALATLNGKLFIPFFICLVYILLSPSKEDDRAKKYLVYPSLILMFILFNPIFIHLLYKFIAVPERIVRMYWPLPMDLIFVYCVIRFFGALGEKWKKAVLIFMAAVLLLINMGGSYNEQSYSLADNVEKMPKGTKEVCDALHMLNDYQDPYVIMPSDLFFWIREYNPHIRIPYIRQTYWETILNGKMDLDLVGQTAVEGGCRFVVLNSSHDTEGDITDYGFELATTIEGQDCEYYIYMIK